MNNLTRMYILGESKSKTAIITFNGILAPFLSLVGTLTCFLTAFILNKRIFHHKMYVFYRVSAVLNCVSLLINVPYLILSSFTSDTSSTILAISFAAFTRFISHLTSWLEIGFVLERMKFFSSKLNRILKVKPFKCCITFSLTCAFIEIFIVLFYASTPNSSPLIIQLYLNKNTVILTFLYVVKYILPILFTCLFNLMSNSHLKSYFKLKEEKRSHLVIASAKMRRAIEDQVLREKETKRTFFITVVIFCIKSLTTRTFLFVHHLLLLFYKYNENKEQLYWSMVTLENFVYILDPTLVFFILFYCNRIFKRKIIKLLKSIYDFMEEKYF
jgi:hypothetical protein